MREQIGWNYLFTLISVTAVNFLVVFQQLAAVIIRRLRLHYKRHQNKLKAEAKIRERWKYDSQVSQETDSQGGTEESKQDSRI